MLKTFLWVVSNDGRFFQDAIKILERQHNGIDLVGVTAHVPINIAFNGKNIPFVPLDKIDAVGGGYDVLLVVGAKQIGMSKITQAARQIKLPEEKLLGDWIVCIPGFELDKYRRLQRSRLSIFSVNCTGGLFSNILGLPFLSPFVNLYLPNEDFLKVLRSPRVYMEERLTYQTKKFDKARSHEYPVANLGNVTLNMLHYKNFDESVATWNKRKARINWYNIIAIMWTENLEELEQFDALPYGKKVCFVPFKSDLDSAWYVEHRLKDRFPHYVHYVLETAQGRPFCYDPFDMLLYGKKTPLIKM